MMSDKFSGADAARGGTVLALVGNQNCGKTALFNRLTGANQHVGNFPGVTVERKVGTVRGAQGCTVVDLPGVYSLHTYSGEEDVTLEFLRNGQIDCIINIVDAGNLERNLYLTLQLLELRRPMVLALNMMDEVRANGGTVRAEKLSSLLGVPVIPISARRNEGIEALRTAAVAAARRHVRPRPSIPSGTDARYTYIDRLCRQAVVWEAGESRQHWRSVKIDRVLTNRYAALPIFFGVMALVFWLTFHGPGALLQRLLASGIDRLTGVVARVPVHPIVQSLVVDGIFAGLGTVLSFLPVIVVLFFCLSVLEDTGYMARVAFITDRLFAKLGLSGQSFVPLLLGFGCTVPAALATRTLPSTRGRKITLLLTPFFSCSAKIPIYAVFCAAFFPRHAALVMGLLYFGGIAVGVGVALVLKKTAHQEKHEGFLLELPNYRLPSARSIALLLWERARDFLTRAFTVIFLGTLAVWFLQSFDRRLQFTADCTTSLLADLGRLLTPLFAPIGLGDWRITTAFVAGFTAKEAVVSTLGVLLGTKPLSAGLPTLFTPASAVCFLCFTLLYTPCIAAVSAIGRELGGKWRGAALAVAQSALAWGITALVHAAVRCFI